MKLRTPILLSTAVASVLAASTTSAFAGTTGGTGTTFTVSGGSLDVTVGATATLNTVASGTTLIAGSLGASRFPILVAAQPDGW